MIDVIWCQPFKLIHVVSTSEFDEYLWNDVDFILYSGTFLIVKTRVIFAIKCFLKIEIFWGQEVFKLHF